MILDHGFRALAYPADIPLSPLSPCQCSMVFNSGPLCATLLLVVEIARANSAEVFVIQYDADKLVSKDASLKSGNNPALQLHVGEILRVMNDKRPQIKTLTLKVQPPVPVWSLPLHNSHEPGWVSSYSQFLDLVKATAVQIVFDYKFLSPQHQGPFRAFSKAPKNWSGFPVELFLSGQGLRKTSLTDLSPVVDDIDAPPAYVKPGKRLRQATSTSTPPSPPHKRSTLQSPTRSNKSDATVPDSPTTAEAISAAFLYKAAINAIPCELSPAHLQKDLAQTSSNRSTPDSDLSKLHAALKSPSFSPLSSSPPEPPLLTPWGRLLVTQLRTLLATEFQREQTRQFKRFEKLLDRLSDAAECARTLENARFEDDLEDHKADLRLAKEDCVADLSADIEALYAQGRQECLNLQDNLTEMFDNTFGELCDRIESIKQFELRRIVAAEVKRYGRRRRGVKRDIEKPIIKPIIKHDPKLLGRKREAEWVDC